MERDERKPENENEDEKMTTMEAATKRNYIVGKTPVGYDPLIYWHQVATDAIKSAEKERENAKQERTERERVAARLNSFTNIVAEKATDQRAKVPLDLSRLIDRAATGDIDLNLSIYISKGRNE